MNRTPLGLGLIPLILLLGCRGAEVGIPPDDVGTMDAGGNLPDANVIDRFDGGAVDGGLVAPTLNDVTPGVGSERGGTRVVLRGSGFAEPAEVRFGDVPATSVVVLDEVSIAATTPAGSIGPVRVTVQTPGGLAELPDGFEYLPNLRVTEIQPARVPEEGGVPVVVLGEGFNADTLVLFDREPLRGHVLVSDTRIEGYVPALTPGRAQVHVLHRRAEAVRGDLLYVYATPEPYEIVPGYTDVNGQTLHALAGDGFEEASSVVIGNNKVDTFSIETGERIELEAPALIEGTHDIEVQNADASGVLRGGFVVYDSSRVGGLSLIGLVPDRASTAGGDQVTAIGYGFQAGATVDVGGFAALSVQFESENVLSFVVPPGLPVGAASVVVTTGGSTLGATLRVYEPIQVTSITPDRGPTAGNIPVTIQGAGFTADVEVRVADVPLSDIVVVSDTEITGSIVAGGSGAADVLVKNGDSQDVLVGGFLFEAPFELIRIAPIEGSMAGNTFVTAYGRGFVGPATVEFGGVAGVDPTVENGSVISVRTPAGRPGRVPVKVSASGADVTLDDAYRYYNPTLITGGAWGGPIEGSVNVAVLNINSGEPMEGIVVQLGLDADPRYANVTDANGLATISWPHLLGAQTVTTGQNGVEHVTFMELNARNVTVLAGVHPVVPEEPPPPQPCPEPQEGPVIRGRVYKFKSSLDQTTRPGWAPVARITYTQASVFAANPPEPATQEDFVFADGQEYEITPARVGTIAVYAILGDFNSETQQFVPRKFGVVRQVPSVAGEATEGVNIALDFDLDQTVSVRLDTPPVQVPGPSGNIVFPYLNLGSEGVIPFNPQVTFLTDAVPISGLPDIAGSSFFYLSGSMTQNANGQFGAPYSLSIVESASELSDGVDAGPFLRMPQNVTPKTGRLLEDGVLAWDQPGITPDVTTVFVSDSVFITGSCCIDIDGNGECGELEPVMGGGAPVPFNRWSVFAKGGLESYVMPRMLPGIEAFDTPRVYGYVVQQAVAPRFNYSEFIYNQFSPFFWKSWTVSFDQFLAKEDTD